MVLQFHNHWELLVAVELSAQCTDKKVNEITPALFAEAFKALKALQTIPGVPWRHVVRLASDAGLTPSGPVVFECVGVPGLLDRAMRDAPRSARIVVAGVCMEDDRIRPMIGINKELSLQFVLGYQPHEFAGTLNAIAEGRIDVAPLITDRVRLDDVPEAFERLRSPESQAKILVEPWRS